MSTFQYGGNVNANGIRQHYLRFGGQEGARASRDTLVVIPGITSPAVTWAFVGERFGAQFDTYILDVRGRGLTSSGPGLDYSLDAQAADVLAFVKALGLTRYALVGHSMGARIAIRAARTQPAGLTRLALVDPPTSGPGRRPYPAALPWYVDSIRLANEGCDRETMRRFCPTWTDEQLDVRAEWLHTCFEPAIVASFEAFQTDDIHQDLPKLNVPTLLVGAERGDVIKPEDAEEMTGLVPGSRFTRVPGAGHMIPWDNEEGFYEALQDFLGAPLAKGKP